MIEDVGAECPKCKHFISLHKEKINGVHQCRFIVSDDGKIRKECGCIQK